jgi:hypothetical protein
MKQKAKKINGKRSKIMKTTHSNTTIPNNTKDKRTITKQENKQTEPSSN